MDNIRKIYLFGSAARGELGKNSDIDLFIDCEKEKQIEKHAKLALSKFYKSKDYDKWRQLGFSYNLSIHAGNLKEWSLKSSIMADGILLFSKTSELSEGQRHVLISLILPKDKKKYLRFIRMMFGREEQVGEGILGEAKGKKLSSNVIMCPKENVNKVLELMNKEKMNYSIHEIFIL